MNQETSNHANVMARKSLGDTIMRLFAAKSLNQEPATQNPIMKITRAVGNTAALVLLAILDPDLVKKGFEGK